MYDCTESASGRGRTRPRCYVSREECEKKIRIYIAVSARCLFTVRYSSRHGQLNRRRTATVVGWCNMILLLITYYGF